jgi:CRP-like cAMP-binding protein
MEEILRKHIEKIVGLTDEEFTFVISHFAVKSFRKNEFLIRPGENVRYFYFVISGLLKLGYPDDLGKEHIISFAMEDWWETDFPAFYSQAKATMTLQCLEDTEVYCLSLEDYRKLCGLHKMEHFFLEKAVSGHIASQQRILSFIMSNAQERFEALLKRYPTFYQRLPKTLLASYLGVSRETLSRLLP